MEWGLAEWPGTGKGCGEMSSDPHVDRLRGQCASVSDFLFVRVNYGDRDLVSGGLSLERPCRKDTEPRAEGPRDWGLTDTPHPGWESRICHLVWAGLLS